MKLICAANWWSTPKTGPITCQITCYKDGLMYKGTNTTATPPNDKNFYNIGGRNVFQQDAVFYSSSKASGGSYLIMATVEYDRKRHNAKVTFGTNQYVTKSSYSNGRKNESPYGDATYYYGVGTISSMTGVVE